MANIGNNSEPTKTEKICIHKKYLWALDQEQVKYTIANSLDSCSDIVWINLELTSSNVLYLFHAGYRMAKQSSNHLTPVAA